MSGPTDCAGSAPGDPESALLERLRAAAAGDDVRTVLRLLREPFVTRRIVKWLLERRELLQSAPLRRDLAAHPQTPEARALRLVATLFWRDLIRLGADSRVRPTVRRAADTTLAQRLPLLTLGEKMAIARSAGQGVLFRLRHDPNPEVISALLDNPRLSEPLLQPVLASATASPAVLALVAGHRKWGNRYGVRTAICRNPRTPPATALGLLAMLRKAELRMVRSDPRLAEPLRRKASLLLGL